VTPSNDNNIKYLCTNIDDEWYLITSCRSEHSGELMLAVLESTFPMAWFDLLSDCPSLRLDEYDYDEFQQYRLELIRPAPRANKRPKLSVISGGLDK
jgi:hypothetical protein